MKYLDYAGLQTTWKAINPHVCFYGVCDTTGSVQAKWVAVSGMSDIVAGTRVLVRFTYANTAAAPTLQISSTHLNINNNPACLIVDEEGKSLSHIVAGMLHGLCEFVYDGNGHWVLLSNKAANQIIYTEGSTEPEGEPGMIWLKKKQ